MQLYARRLLATLLAAVLLGTVLVASTADATALADTHTGRPDQAVLMMPGSTPALAEGIMADVGGDYLSPVTQAPNPFTHALLRWEAFEPVSDTLTLELRASIDGETWTDWGLVPENPDLWVPEDGDQIYWSQEIYAGEGASFWQVRARFAPAPDGRLPELRRIEVNTVDARFGPTDTALEPELAQVATSLARPPVISRTAWGNPDGQGSRVTPAYYPVTHMVVHHTADANSLSGSQQNWADRVRAIWSFHTFTRGWGDIGYNYLVDPNGIIYEGRAGGDDAVAFHDTANYGSMGVVLIGTYTTVDPRPAAVDSLVSLLAWKADQKDIDPLGRSRYYGCTRSSYCNPFNAGGIVQNISGHRQVTPGHTTCPGDRLLNLLPSVRQRVSERLAGGGTPLPQARLDLLSVQYDRQSLAAGELLKITFTVRNSGSVPIEGQAPEAAPRPELAAGYDLAESYVYDEAECFLGAEGQSYPAFPKETGRFRVLLGPIDGARQPACAGGTGGYPWRWGINGRLEPGATREVVGYVRLRTPGPIALQAGAINEYVGYMATGTGSTTIAVTPERTMPAPAAYDEGLRPLAHVYLLGTTPDNLLARAADTAAAPRGAYAGSFPWDGSPISWGAGGPLAERPDLADRFVVEQTRAFLAPTAGDYSFEVRGDDGAWLWVNGRLVASRTALSANAPVIGTIRLEAGIHTLAFRMFERSGDAAAGYQMRGPGQEQFGPPSDGLAISPIDRLGASFRQLGGLAIVADDMGGAGVAAVRVSVNGGPWEETQGPVATVGALPDGRHTVSYLSVDGAGNISEERTLSLLVDTNLVVHKVYMPTALR